MNIVGQIASAFEAGDGAVEAATISGKLDIPAEFAEKILAHLVSAGILVRAAEPKDGFLPAKAPANMKLSEIAAAISLASFAQSADMPSQLRKVADSQRDALSQYTVKQLLQTEDQAQT
jgi:DNA-binding IscR family transcriptional regulator